VSKEDIAVTVLMPDISMFFEAWEYHSLKIIMHGVVAGIDPAWYWPLTAS
jgi:hypothetical protein